eukprot:scaffold32375_cov107-Isochrysis_galbana.AAC.1
MSTRISSKATGLVAGCAVQPCTPSAASSSRAEAVRKSFTRSLRRRARTAAPLCSSIPAPGSPRVHGFAISLTKGGLLLTVKVLDLD